MALKELKSTNNLYTYQTDLKLNCQRDGASLKAFDYRMTGMISTYHYYYETPSHSSGTELTLLSLMLFLAC